MHTIYTSTSVLPLSVDSESHTMSNDESWHVWLESILQQRSDGERHSFGELPISLKQLWHLPPLCLLFSVWNWCPAHLPQCITSSALWTRIDTWEDVLHLWSGRSAHLLWSQDWPIPPSKRFYNMALLHCLYTQDKRTVDEPSSSQNVWWGKINMPMSEHAYRICRERAMDYLNIQERLYVVDAFAGWDPKHRIKVCAAL